MSWISKNPLFSSLLLILPRGKEKLKMPSMFLYYRFFCPQNTGAGAIAASRELLHPFP